MVCNDCGHEISMNKLCETPIQSSINMLNHMAAHNASRAFLPVVDHVAQPEPDAAPSGESAPSLSASERHWIASMPQSSN